ncbi:MAG: 50S ribosomal protein L5 [Clostridia bacterium]|nr:50S ribosomal protein L5 [Clostridia bacterium]
MKDEVTQVAKETPTDSKTVASKKAKPRLQDYYESKVVSTLQKELGYKNINQVPRLDKIVINAGLGDVKDNAKSFNMAVDELGLITGQKPLVTTAKKAVANFKLREGMKIGAKVTLRGDKMWEFMDRLISIALPRVRDFRGISTKSFDGKGNYSMGIKEQLVFPEIDYDKIEKVRGFDICIVTSANTDDEAKALLTALGMPFKKA